MNQNKIDYSALSTNYSFAHIARKYVKKVGGPILFGVALLVIYFSVVGASIVSQDPNDAVKSFVIRFATSSLVFILFVIIFIVYWLIDFAGGYKEKGRLKDFSKANGITYTSDAPSSGYQGLIFSNNISDRVESSIQIPAATGVTDFDFEIANYRYQSRYTDSKKTYYKGFVKINLNKDLPNIVLNSKANDSLLSDTLPGSFKSKQKLSLEGNFDKYFDLYTPKTYKRDALYFLTPDVMHALIENCPDVDIEIVDSFLYFYYADKIDLTNQETYIKNIEMTKLIFEQLKKPSNRYKDHRVAVAEVAQPQIAKHGRRLEKRKILTFLPMIILVLLPAAWLLSEIVFPGHLFITTLGLIIAAGIARLAFGK